MRVKQGYRPRIKFTATMDPELRDRLEAYCVRRGQHLSRVIDEAVRHYLEKENQGVTMITPRSGSARAARAKPLTGGRT